MAMTMVEKILARAAGRKAVKPGEIVNVAVDTTVLIDLNFYHGYWHEFKKIADPERVVVIFDHIVPPKDLQSAEALKRGRNFIKRFGIERVHDVGPRMGISHQLIADEAYALPGSVLACIDSHTCSAGAFNCLARGMGNPEMVFITAKGTTWFWVADTIQYRLEGTLSPEVSAKDIFLHIANEYGDHANYNVEFVGPAIAQLSLNARRTLATMCSEISVEFVVFEADSKVVEHVRARTARPFEPQFADAGARYADIRTIDLAAIEPMVAWPDSVVRNSRPVGEARGVSIDQAFIGSCANGTLDDLEVAAQILKDRKVASTVTLIVTPGSQAIYAEAVKRGYVETLVAAGAVVTSSTCGACAGLHMGVLAAGERCITASTRNFRGRMGSPEAEIFMGSPATVAASAIRGEIADPRQFIGGRG
jgi:3-isopropylmalate/(R)-2-methylmalate dehydratase large subunit